MTTMRVTLLASLAIAGLCRGAPAQQQTATTPNDADVSANAITAPMLALGDSIFHGKAGGGACFMCHGADAKGTPGLAPSLAAGKTGKKWLHGDGTYGAIIEIVRHGVPDPKEEPAPMPPMGGASFTPQQLQAVAAYVYSLSHPEIGGYH